MVEQAPFVIHRRRFVLAAASGVIALAAPSLLRAQGVETTRRNLSSFRTHEWRDHFESLDKGIIISDTITKVLQHWTTDGEMRIYPTSVPLTDELTKRGYTEVVEKRENPSWAPTPSMRERNPEWPALIPGGDPANPLGTRALSVLAVLPDPRNAGYSEDRAQVVERMYWPLQRTYRGSL